MFGSKPLKYGSGQIDEEDEFSALLPASSRKHGVSDEEMETLGYRVISKKHCAPRKLRLPIFFDLITDRSRSRFLTPLLFTLAFLLLIDVLIIKNLTDPLIALRQPSLPSLDVFVPPKFTGVIGQPLAQQPQAQIRNHFLLGLKNQVVSISLSRIYLTSGWLSHFSDQICDFQNPISDTTLLSLQYASLCNVSLSGTTARTDDLGIAKFSDFMVVDGPEGIYEFEFQTRLQTDSINRIHHVSFSSVVGALEILPLDPFSLPLQFPLQFHFTLPPFLVRVLDTRGRPLPARVVRLVALPALLNSTAVRRMQPRSALLSADFQPPLRATLLAGDRARTNASGIALFDAFQVLASSVPQVFFAVAAETVAANIAFTGPSMTDVLYPTALLIQDINIRLINSPSSSVSSSSKSSSSKLSSSKLSTPTTSSISSSFSASVMEGTPMASPMAVSVASFDGTPLANMTVFAQLLSWNDQPWSPQSQFLSAYFSNTSAQLRHPHKFLLNPTATTNASGVALFSALAFSTSGPAGFYTVQFSCQGVSSAAAARVQVLSAVASVQVDWPLDTALYPLVTLSPVRILPQLFLADALGRPVVGKLAVLRVSAASPSADVAYTYAMLAADQSGMIQFEAFMVTAVTGAPGTNYTVSFSVDGVASAQTFSSAVVDASAINSTWGLFATCAAVAPLGALPASLALGVPAAPLQFRAYPTSPRLPINPALRLQLSFFSDGIPYPHVTGNKGVIDSRTGLITFPQLTMHAGYSSVLQVLLHAPSEDYCYGQPFEMAFRNPVSSVELFSNQSRLEGYADDVFAFQFLLQHDSLFVLSNISDPILQYTTLDLVLAPSDLMQSLPLYPPDTLYTYAVTVDQLAPDLQALRVAIQITSGDAGSFQWRLNVAGILSEIIQVTILSRVKTMSLLFNSPPSSPLDIAFGVPFSLQLQLQDDLNQPVPGPRVGVFPCSLNSTDLFIGNTQGDTLGSPWSSPADSLGVVSWPQLSVWQALSETPLGLCFATVSFPNPSNPLEPKFLWDPDASYWVTNNFQVLSLQILNNAPFIASVGANFIPSPTLALTIGSTDPDDNATSTLEWFVAGARPVGLETILDHAFPQYRDSPPIGTFSPPTNLVCLATACQDPASFLLFDPAFPFFNLGDSSLSLTPLQFQTAEPGLYRTQVVLPGSSEVYYPAGVTQIVPFPFYLQVLLPPPDVVSVNQEFQVILRATAYGGSGVPRKLVRAILFDGDSNRTNPILDEPTRYAISNENGMAVFNFIINKGKSGDRFYFEFLPAGDLGIVSLQSVPTFSVFNPVHTLVIKTQPKGLWSLPFWMDPVGFIFGSKRKYVLSTGDTATAIGSLQQPVVCLFDIQDQPLVGFQVTVQNMFAWDKSEMTDEEGCYHFRNLRVQTGISGKYRMIFDAYGVQIEAAHEFIVYSPLISSEESFEGEDSDAGVFLLAALLIPMFFANSLWVTSPLIVSVGFGLGIVVLGWFLIARCLQIYSLSVDASISGISLSWQLVALFLLLATFIPAVVYAILYWKGKEKKYFYEFKRMQVNLAHVKKLLNPNYDVEVYDYNDSLAVRCLLGIEQTWRWMKINIFRCCKCCERFSFGSCCQCCSRSNEHTESLWKEHVTYPYARQNENSDEDIVYDERPESFHGFYSRQPQRLPSHTLCGWRMRNMCCPIRRGDAYTTSIDWVFPQRFIMAVFLSILATFVTFLWSIWAVRRFESFMVIGQAYLVFGQVWTLRLARILMGSSSASAYLFTNYVEVYVPMFFQFFVQMLDRVRYRFFWTGTVAAVIAVLVLYLTWIDIFGAYKRFLLTFRSGEMRRNFPADHFHVGNASRYPGVQSGHCIFGYFLIFFTMWAFLLILSTALFRRLIWNFFIDIFIYILGLHLALTLIRMTVTNFILTSGFDIRYPRFYFFWDFINTLAEVVAGLSTTLLRLGVGIGGLILTFTRIHLPLLGWDGLQGFDAGYASFISTVYVDHMYNNPVLNVFLYLMLEKQRFLRERGLKIQKIDQPHPLHPSSDEESLDHIDDDEEDEDVDEQSLSRFSFSASSKKLISNLISASSNTGLSMIPEDPSAREIRLRSHRARMRWHLAYLLIRNPSLRQYRRTYGKPLAAYGGRFNPMLPPREPHPSYETISPSPSIKINPNYESISEYISATSIQSDSSHSFDSDDD